MGTVNAFTIYKPLVVVVVIGDYKNSPLPSIKDASNDYYNAIRAFNYSRGYDVVFATNTGFKHLTNHDQNGILNTNEIKSFDFKLKWVEDDMQDFNTHISQEILSSSEIKENAGDRTSSYDSLIYILSSQGDSVSCFYDSNGEELSSEYIYYEFNNTNCKLLRQRPKIYLFDIGRIDSDIYTSSSSKKSQNNTTHNIQSKNIKLPKLTPSLPVLDTKTYTEKSHCCTIFGNSKQQPVIWKNARKDNYNGSLFIASICNVVCHNFTFLNSSFGDVLFETRQNMANVLSSSEKRVKLDEIVLNERSTMPYDIKFSSSATIDEKESKTNVCSLIFLLQFARHCMFVCGIFCVCVCMIRMNWICMITNKK